MENLLNSNIKILLAYEESGLRAGLVALLKNFGFRTFYEANDGVEALALLEDYNPHVIILDIEMPRMNGFELMNHVKKKYPSIKMIVLSKYTGYFSNDSSAFELADALFSKNFKPEELVVMVTTLALDRRPVKALKVLPVDLDSVDVEKVRRLAKQTCLTDKEVEVLKFVCDGKSNKEISMLLNLTLKTIEFHRKNIHRKTKTKSIPDLMRYAIKHRFTHLE